MNVEEIRAKQIRRKQLPFYAHEETYGSDIDALLSEIDRLNEFISEQAKITGIACIVIGKLSEITGMDISTTPEDFHVGMVLHVEKYKLLEKENARLKKVEEAGKEVVGFCRNYLFCEIRTCDIGLCSSIKKLIKAIGGK